jgi:hypothetical protein
MTRASFKQLFLEAECSPFKTNKRLPKVFSLHIVNSRAIYHAFPVLSIADEYRWQQTQSVVAARGCIPGS